MDEGYLPGLAYLNTGRGINPIVEKLPYGLREKWVTAGSKYKDHFKVAFPPFTFFSELVRNQARTRNYPSFALTSFVNTQPSKKEAERNRGVNEQDWDGQGTHWERLQHRPGEVLPSPQETSSPQ